MTEPLGDPIRLAGPFTRADGRAAGLTDNHLESNRYRRVFHNVWVPADLEDSRELRLDAARLVIPDRGVLCGLTAAWIYRADVRRLDDYDVHVGFPKDQRIRKRPGLAVCQETLDPSDITRIEGVQVTTPLRTAFDCLRLLKGADRIVVADALTHLELVQLDQLREYFVSKRRLRNLRVGEALLDDGLPRPQAQHNVYDVNGSFIGRPTSPIRRQGSGWNTTELSTGSSAGRMTDVVRRFASRAGRCSSIPRTTSTSDISPCATRSAAT